MEDTARANEELITGFYAARAAHQPLERFLAADVVWEVPGTSPISGMHMGIDAVLEYIAHRDELAHGSLTIEVHHVVAGVRKAIMYSTSHAVREGVHRDSPGLAVFDISDGKIARCRLIPSDQGAFDTFWS